MWYVSCVQRELLERTIRQHPVAKTLREVESLEALGSSRRHEQHNDDGQVVQGGVAPAEEEGGGGGSLLVLAEPRGGQAGRALPEEENRGQDRADRDKQPGRGLDDENAVRVLFRADAARREKGGAEDGGASEEWSADDRLELPEARRSGSPRPRRRVAQAATTDKRGARCP